MKKKQKVLTEHQQELENEVNKQMNEIYNNKDKKVKSTKNIRKLIPFYSKYKLAFVSFIVVLLIYIVISFFEPMIAGEIVQRLTTKEFDIVLRYALYYLLMGCILAIIHYGLAELKLYLSINMNFDLRQNLMSHIDRLSMKKLDNVNSAVLISRLESDCGRCSNAIMNIVDNLIMFIRSFVFFIYIAFIDIWLFLILLAYVLIKYFLDGYRFKLMREARKVNRRRYDNAYNVYYEQIRGIRDVKSLNLRENMLKVSAEKVKYVYDLDVKVDKKMNNSYYFLSFPLDYIVEFALIFVGIMMVKSNPLLFAGFMIVYMYRGRALSVSSYYTRLKEQFTEGELSAERYFDIVDRYEKEKFGNIEKKIEKGEIELKNVKFEYEENAKFWKVLT